MREGLVCPPYSPPEDVQSWIVQSGLMQLCKMNVIDEIQLNTWFLLKGENCDYAVIKNKILHINMCFAF